MADSLAVPPEVMATAMKNSAAARSGLAELMSTAPASAVATEDIPQLLPSAQPQRAIYDLMINTNINAKEMQP